MADVIQSELNRIKKTFYSNGLRKDRYELKQHKVKSGETIYSIAEKYKIDFRDLEKYNPEKVKRKLINGKAIINGDGKVQYEIEKGASLVFFQKKAP